MLFKNFIEENSTTLKTFMKWENYELNEIVLPVVEEVQNHALQVLANNYGKFEVDEDILDEVSADVFMNFPTLLQQLSISRIMSSQTVPEIDILTESFTRTETGLRDSSQNSDIILGSKVVESSESNTTNTTTGTNKQTGTVSVDNDTLSTQNSETDIVNTSGIEATGGRSVSLSNSMPEQALNETGDFPIDSQGTPEIGTAYVQNATQNFNTVNPIDTSETSNQNIQGTVETQNNSTTTNDLTNTQDTIIENVGDTNRTLENSGTDSTINSTLENVNNEVTEVREREVTNAQYAYEIKAFLESTDSLNAFKRWCDNFSWVCGIV